VSLRPRLSYARAIFSIAGSWTPAPRGPYVHIACGSHSSPHSQSIPRLFLVMIVPSPQWVLAMSRSECLQRGSGSNLCYKTFSISKIYTVTCFPFLTSHSTARKSISLGKVVMFTITGSPSSLKDNSAMTYMLCTCKLMAHSSPSLLYSTHCPRMPPCLRPMC
jgi:hypothetical protein